MVLRTNFALVLRIDPHDDDSVAVMHQAVEDGVGEGGIADDIVPVFGVQGRESPVIEHRQIGLDEAAHELVETAVGMGEAKFLEQPGP